MNDKMFSQFYVRQINYSYSKRHVVRGLHMQLNRPQSKLVRPIEGVIVDNVVDVRPQSPDFGKVHRFRLDSKAGEWLFVPRGFLHGFSVLSERAVIIYSCDEVYCPEHEISVNPLDVDLCLDWGLPFEKAVVSDKDSKGMLYRVLLDSLRL